MENNKDPDHEESKFGFLAARMLGAQDKRKEEEENLPTGQGDPASDKVWDNMGDVFHKVGDFDAPKPHPVVDDKVVDEYKEVMELV